jgi:hypothetical protein
LDNFNAFDEDMCLAHRVVPTLRAEEERARTRYIIRQAFDEALSTNVISQLREFKELHMSGEPSALYTSLLSESQVLVEKMEELALRLGAQMSHVEESV